MQPEISTSTHSTYHLGRQPALFIGHGSPALALSSDDLSVQTWKNLANNIPRPKSILAISAHWYISETSVTAQVDPTTIHDFNGFPQQMYDIQYPAPGDPTLAKRVSEIVALVDNGEPARLDGESWGLDHGTWAVLKHMYPRADIPVVQLSINENRDNQFYYRLGNELAKLRDEGVLILGSGNLVHNFAYLSSDSEPPSWAAEYVQWIKDVTLDSSIDRKSYSKYPLVHWESHPYGPRSQMSPDHFVPVLFVLGTADNGEPISWHGERWDMSSLYMGCIQVG